MNGLLAFLLFAGSLHVDFAALRSRVAVVGAMATMGVLLSTVLVGLAMWSLSGLVGVELPLLWALVFGDLISSSRRPTRS
jgi:monovalent cation:H+ antiporter, CPA1 family